MNSRYFGYIMMVIAVVMMGLSSIVLAQPLPAPIAHYPLRVDNFRSYVVVQPWDVSGNANHGNTFNPVSDTLYDKGLTHVHFPDTTNGSGITVLGKMALTQQYVNIPNVYTSTYTISFWIYYRGDMSSATQTIVKLPSLMVQAQQDKISVAVNTGSALTMKTSSAPVFGGEGWYLVAVNSSNNLSVKMYNASVFKSVSFGNATSGTPYSQSISQLIGTDFKGGLCDVRFYDQLLNTNQLDSIYLEGLLFAKHQQSPTSYVAKNVYANYPLTKADFKRNVSRFPGRNGTAVSGVSGVTDRYNRPDSAASFPSTNAYISLPPYWNTYFNNYTPYTNDTPKGFTISYWMNITQAISTPTGGIQMPFDNNSPRNKIFYGRQNGIDLFGMQQILDRIGIFRYNDITSTRYPWYLWLYDPLSFRNNTGWYHIVWVQYQDWMRMYVYKPDGKMVCNSYYIEIPEAVKTITDWGLGNNAGSGTAQSLILDDFKIYNWPLNPGEVRGLDSLERPPSLPMAKECGDCYTFGNPSRDVQMQKSNVVVYPNPATDKITIELKAIIEEDIHVTLSRVDGVVFVKRTQTLHSGDNRMVLDGLALPPGNYLITISGSKTLSGTHKVTIL